MTHTDKRGSLSITWFMLSNALPPIGFFLYLKHRNQSPEKANRALWAGLAGIPIGIAAGYLFNTYIFQ